LGHYSQFEFVNFRRVIEDLKLDLTDAFHQVPLVLVWIGS